MIRISYYLTLTAAFLSGGTPAALAVISVNASSNSLAIQSITYDINGSQVTQNSSDNGSADRGDNPIDLVEIDFLDGITRTLDNFNTGGVQAVNLNFPANPSGFDVIDGANTIDTSDIEAFRTAIQGVFSSTNIRNYVNKSSGAPQAPPPGQDFDIIYQFGLTADDYILVAERDGNSSLQLDALDATGNRISGSETLLFASGGSAPYLWDTGYGSLEDPNGNQSINLAVIDAELFNAAQPIFGIRVTNTSGADIKILAASEDTFTNNPEIPEPRSFALLLGFGALVFAGGKRRRR